VGSASTPSTAHPIEAESYRILAARVDLSAWAAGPAAVAARVVHATAEPGLLGSLVVDQAAVDAGVAALRSGAPVLCDVEMVRAGISGARAVCLLGDVDGIGPYPSRSAAAMSRAAARHPDGAVVVVGCAPTALAEVNRLLARGSFRPALVVGVPVGFVGAAESTEALLAAAAAAGVPAIALRGERGGAAVAAAVVNALVRLSAVDGEGAVGSLAREDGRAMLLIGHGTRSEAGEAELRRFADEVARARPEVPVGAGFIEFLRPDLDEAVDDLVRGGAGRVVAVPLVLLGAGHMKDDGPAALTRARHRHPGVDFSYARELGVHPDVLATVGERIARAITALPGGEADAVVVVGRGSSDPDANADLAKAARLLADGHRLTGGAGSDLASDGSAIPPLGLVVPAFVSLARPDVATALDHCARLGARRIAVVPYFLFTGLLVDRIEVQAADWAAGRPEVTVVTGPHMGIAPRLVALTWHRYDEAAGGPVHMNCDGCLYRTPLPGYEHRVGAAPFAASAPRSIG
jgi:precorrin isomerase/sirohydrochlorin ferrochelatase